MGQVKFLNQLFKINCFVYCLKCVFCITISLGLDLKLSAESFPRQTADINLNFQNIITFFQNVKRSRDPKHIPFGSNLSFVH